MPHVKFKCNQQENNVLQIHVVFFRSPCYIVLHVSLLTNLQTAIKPTAQQTLHCTNQKILLPFPFYHIFSTPKIVSIEFIITSYSLVVYGKESKSYIKRR